MDEQKVLQLITRELADFFQRHLSFRARKITDRTSDAYGVNNSGASSVGTSQLQNAAVTKTKLSYEQVAVTVSAGNTSGTGTVTSGSLIFGFRPTGNCDQFVDNISVSGTTLTVILGAAATADNTFEVTLLKA